MNFHSLYQSRQAFGDRFNVKTECVDNGNHLEDQNFQLQSLDVRPVVKLPGCKKIHPFLRHLAVNDYFSFMSIVQTRGKMEDVEENLKPFPICILKITSRMTDETFLVHAFLVQQPNGTRRESPLQWQQEQKLKEVMNLEAPKPSTPPGDPSRPPRAPSRPPAEPSRAAPRTYTGGPPPPYRPPSSDIVSGRASRPSRTRGQGESRPRKGGHDERRKGKEKSTDSSRTPGGGEKRREDIKKSKGSSNSQGGDDREKKPDGSKGGDDERKKKSDVSSKSRGGDDSDDDREKSDASSSSDSSNELPLEGRRGPPPSSVPPIILKILQKHKDKLFEIFCCIQ